MTTESLNVHVLKNGTCPTLSGRGSLKYEIGADEASASLAIPAAASSTVTGWALTP